MTKINPAKNINTNMTKFFSQIKTPNVKLLNCKLETLGKDVFERTETTVKKIGKALPKAVPFFIKGATVNLTERTAANSAVERELLSSIDGYVDSQGNILPYLFVEGLRVEDKGKGLGKEVMAKIIKIAKERYGGRLVLKPENRDCNPSPFYAKCGLVSMTEKGKKEILNYFEHNIPFESGYSDPMYLPIIK